MKLILILFRISTLLLLQCLYIDQIMRFNMKIKVVIVHSLFTSYINRIRVYVCHCLSVLSSLFVHNNNNNRATAFTKLRLFKRWLPALHADTHSSVCSCLFGTFRFPYLYFRWKTWHFKCSANRHSLYFIYNFGDRPYNFLSVASLSHPFATISPSRFVPFHACICQLVCVLLLYTNIAWTYIYSSFCVRVYITTCMNKYNKIQHRHQQTLFRWRFVMEAGKQPPFAALHTPSAFLDWLIMLLPLTGDDASACVRTAHIIRIWKYNINIIYARKSKPEIHCLDVAGSVRYSQQQNARLPKLASLLVYVMTYMPSHQTGSHLKIENCSANKFIHTLRLPTTSQIGISWGRMTTSCVNMVVVVKIMNWMIE